MAFTIKRPSSKRFFQLSFEGFRPSGRNKIEQFVSLWSDFFRSLTSYIFKKLWLLVVLIIKLIALIVTIPSEFKDFLTKKLIWSRGRLGRPIATGFIMTFSLLVFMFGEVFNSSSLVVNKPVSADYLKSTIDIIPKKEMALTTLPSERRTKSIIYIVQHGDNLYTIGNQFKVSIDALMYINGLTDSSILSVGQEITIPPISGLIHKVESGDTLDSIALKFDVASQAIADFNYILDTSKLAVGTELVIPGGKIPEIPLPVIYVPTSSYGKEGQVKANKNFCVWPTTVRIITQYYTWYHNGIDIASPSRSGMPPIFACSGGGTVVRAGWDPFGLGLHIRIDHGNGFETVYAHMSRLDVSYGDSVDRGDQLGLMGSTGRSTGQHLHFMVKYNGVPLNPINYTQ